MLLVIGPGVGLLIFFGVIVGFCFIVSFIYWLYLTKIQVGAWEQRAFCACGNNFEAWRGTLFHIHIDICPSCGKARKTWKVRTCRWNRGKWEFKDD